MEKYWKYLVSTFYVETPLHTTMGAVVSRTDVTPNDWFLRFTSETLNFYSNLYKGSTTNADSYQIASEGTVARLYPISAEDPPLADEEYTPGSNAVTFWITCFDDIIQFRFKNGSNSSDYAGSTLIFSVENSDFSTITQVDLNATNIADVTLITNTSTGTYSSLIAAGSGSLASLPPAASSVATSQPASSQAISEADKKVLIAVLVIGGVVLAAAIAGTVVWYTMKKK